MSLCADCLFVYISFRDQGCDTRHYAVVTAFSRVAVSKAYIRIEDDKAVAQVERIVDRGTSGTRHMIAVQGVCIAFVEIHDYRILLVRVEIGGFINNAFQRTPVE